MMDISRGLRFYQQFHRFYNRCLTPLMERQQLSLREIQVLLFLANNPGCDTARDVEKLRGLAKSQVSAAVEHLTGRGLLRRLPDQRDPGGLCGFPSQKRAGPLPGRPSGFRPAAAGRCWRG